MRRALSLLRLPPAVLASGLAAALAGCLFGGGDGPATLPSGAYEVGSTFDQNYVYARYLVVLPDRRWEWVEYGTNGATHQICKVTRRRGGYVLADSALTLTAEEETAPFVKCGLGEDEFRALDFKPVRNAEPAVSRVRSLNSDGFEARDLFTTGKGWLQYSRVDLPFGFDG